MSIWFLTDHHRFAIERKAIDQLQAKVEWLLGVEWSLDASSLCIYANIQAHGFTYSVKLIYPPFFPATPPMVIPVDTKIRWSEHQYMDGSLCLEWGPDNWQPDVTGAQMLESTFRLLDAENPLGKDSDREEVPSRHFLTIGQSMRGKIFRLIMYKKTAEWMSHLEIGKKGTIDLSLTVLKDSATFHIAKIELPDTFEWQHPNLPELISSGEQFTRVQMAVLRTSATTKEIKKLTTLDEAIELFSRLHNYTLDLDLLREQEASSNEIRGVLFIDEQNDLHPYLILNQKLAEMTILMGNEDDISIRRPSSLQGLEEKRIGIVGLGSLGSKVAISLARMGLRKFVLVDEDVFLQANVQRHALDWRDIGFHKVDGVERQLRFIAPNMEIYVSRLNIIGQEATTSLNQVLSRLSTCDVIVDATANGQVFNLLASVSSRYRKAMVWGEVFAGGIGGLIARSRPDIDPDPLTMRRHFHQITVEAPEFELSITSPYTLENENGELWIASDADVSVISSHLTRLIVDTAVTDTHSIFPYSMYLIGLTQEWIFSQPFDTRPIVTEHLPRVEKSIDVMSPEEIKENYDLIK
ncbi:ThiF family adenylyltransferase [Paenactinomyces guangxiensis]|uniref:ThiF family adenylyltransferase n=1 Tax=Paenactinomyces guangxiensis TaxID=1490290 RepID=A0A7W1WUJ0_9BACL|nr:ThiF family adenylyltransferase [Paenactinomyces guangxiensis]MBA4496304.1 ThiF family adenylyltransferase [Paenactinomyces guangxiensis]MBH8593448.1 ThiF family adenylyltransferase [Paenactinomyces guangxiensis]